MLATTGAVLSSINSALALAKAVKDAGSALDQAELRFRLSEVIMALADAKVEMVAVSEDLTQRDARIAELEEAFQSKDAVVRAADAYYHIGANGKPVGQPFCAACWETKHRKFGLHRLQATKRCLSCAKDFDARRTPVLAETGDAAD